MIQWGLMSWHEDGLDREIFFKINFAQFTSFLNIFYLRCLIFHKYTQYWFLVRILIHIQNREKLHIHLYTRYIVILKDSKMTWSNGTERVCLQMVGVWDFFSGSNICICKAFHSYLPHLPTFSKSSLK